MHKPRGCILVFNVHIRRVPLLLNVMAKDNPLKFNSTLPHAQRMPCGLAQKERSQSIGDVAAVGCTAWRSGLRLFVTSPEKRNTRGKFGLTFSDRAVMRGRWNLESQIDLKLSTEYLRMMPAVVQVSFVLMKTSPSDVSFSMVHARVWQWPPATVASRLATAAAILFLLSFTTTLLTLSGTNGLSQASAARSQSQRLVTIQKHTWPLDPLLDFDEPKDHPIWFVQNRTLGASLVYAEELLKLTRVVREDLCSFHAPSYR
jgi:hypothetical protein